MGIILKIPIQISSWNFSPPNCTSVLQPLDQGIIQNFKVYYRKQIVNKLLSEIDHGTSGEENMNVKQAIDMIVDAWRMVSTKTIHNCFNKAGFKQSDNNEPHEIDDPSTNPDILFNWQQLVTKKPCLAKYSFKDYVDIDRDLATSGTKSEESIVSDIQSAAFEEDDEEQASPDEATERAPTTSEYNKALETIRSYYQTRPFDTNQPLNHFASMVSSYDSAKPSAVQSNLHNYFK